MKSRVNLIPKTSLAELIKGIIPMVFIVAVLIFGLFFSGRIYLLNTSLQQVQAKVEQVEQVRQQEMDLKNLVTALETSTARRTELLHQKRQLVDRLFKIGVEKRRFTEPLFLIAEALPPTIRCQTITFSGQKGSFSGTALDYNDLTLLVKKLQDDPIVTSVSLAVTDRDNNEKIEKIQFSIVLELA